MAETGTEDREEPMEIDISEAITARKLDPNSVTEVPPTVETTDGDTRSMDGIGSTFGSKQNNSEQTSSLGGSCIILKSKGIRPRDGQNVSKLQGRT